MPFQDIAKLHMTAAEQALAQNLMQQLTDLYSPYMYNLSAEENHRFGRISEKRKLAVEKVNDYHNSQPALQSPDVDWPEFERDRSTRKHHEMMAIRMMALAHTLTESRRLHDYDNFQNAMVDYEYAKYRNRTDAGLGFDTKVDELKQFFTGGSMPTLPDGVDPI
ncbi:MAG: hypothetical protein K9G46_14750 [Flavobacteriales bacterium]|jgi:hypothetical protein|nr:hypothetical protein [Flavobacteriales bacterium]